MKGDEAPVPLRDYMRASVDERLKLYPRLSDESKAVLLEMERGKGALPTREMEDAAAVSGGYDFLPHLLEQHERDGLWEKGKRLREMILAYTPPKK